MKRISLGAWVGACWAWTLVAQAQVELTWSLANNRTVLMEPVLALVRIVNNSGQTLDLTPRGNAKLTFDVEDQPTSTVAGTGQPLVRRPVIIPDGETRDVEVNLLDSYRIIQGQSYMLTPAVEFAGLRFLGRRLSLEVQPGLELLKREFGLATARNARTVFLRLIHRDRSDRLFCRIDDPAAGLCLGVYELGRIIRFFVPRFEQDRNGGFHVLHQSAPDRFVHSRFDYDGGPQGVTFYTAEVGSIRLVRTDAGEVQVSGATPFQEDPQQAGRLIAPALPPAHPYATTLGEPLVPGRPAPPRPRAPAVAAPRTPTAGEYRDAGSEPVSW